MNGRFFETSRGILINIEAIGSITPVTAPQYIGELGGWDKELEHTPYCKEELKDFGFYFGPEYRWRNTESYRAAAQWCKEHPGCWTSPKWANPGYYEEVEESVKPASHRFSGEPCEAVEEIDRLYFLPTEKLVVPFIYRLHMMMSDGGMNNSHTTYAISVKDFKRLKKVLVLS